MFNSRTLTTCSHSRRFLVMSYTELHVSMVLYTRGYTRPIGKCQCCRLYPRPRGALTHTHTAKMKPINCKKANTWQSLQIRPIYRPNRWQHYTHIRSSTVDIKWCHWANWLKRRPKCNLISTCNESWMNLMHTFMYLGYTCSLYVKAPYI